MSAPEYHNTATAWTGPSFRSTHPDKDYGPGYTQCTSTLHLPNGHACDNMRCSFSGEVHAFGPNRRCRNDDTTVYNLMMPNRPARRLQTTQTTQTSQPTQAAQSGQPARSAQPDQPTHPAKTERYRPSSSRATQSRGSSRRSSSRTAARTIGLSRSNSQTRTRPKPKASSSLHQVHWRE